MAKLSFLGDSLFATGLDTTHLRTGNRWWSGLITAFLGPRLEEYYNNGKGGDTIAEMTARIGEIPADADVVICNGGLNDLVQPEVTAQSMQDDFEALVGALRARGKRVIWVTTIKLKNVEGTGLFSEAARAGFNDYLRSLKTGPDAMLAGLVDMEALHAPHYDPFRNSGDGTHPDTDMCFAQARYIADQVHTVLDMLALEAPVLGLNLLKPSAQNYWGHGGIINNRGATYADGQLATDWRFMDVQQSDETLMFDQEADQSGALTIRFNGTRATPGGADFIREMVPSVDITSGQRIITGFDLETEGLTDVVGVYTQLQLSLSGGTKFVSGGYASANDGQETFRNVPANLGRTTLWSPPVEVSETLTGCHWRIALQYRDGANLSGMLRLSNNQVRVLT